MTNFTAKRGDRWDAGRLTGKGWSFIFDLSIGRVQGLYFWGAVGRRYLWVKLIKGERDR